MIEIVLLGAPRGKERPRGTKDGHFYTPERTRNYEAALKYAAQQVMAGRPPLEGPVRLDIVALIPVPQSWPNKRRVAALAGVELPAKKPDWDNFGKVVDACNLVVWVDDSQVIRGVVEKFYHEKPMMALRITPVTEPPEIPTWVQKHVTFNHEEDGIFA